MTRLLTLGATLMIAAAPLFAQAADFAAAVPDTTLDLSAVLVAIVSTAGALILGIATALINRHMTNSAARANLLHTLGDAVGYAQQSATTAIGILDPRISALNLPPTVAAGVQYTLDHAGADAARFGVTVPLLTQKMVARIGLANVATNQATAASDAPSPSPLAPLVPVAVQAAAQTMTGSFASSLAIPVAPSVPRAG
jgi:hypothetical protein